MALFLLVPKIFITKPYQVEPGENLEVRESKINPLLTDH